MQRTVPNPMIVRKMNKNFISSYLFPLKKRTAAKTRRDCVASATLIRRIFFISAMRLLEVTSCPNEDAFSEMGFFSMSDCLSFVTCPPLTKSCTQVQELPALLGVLLHAVLFLRRQIARPWTPLSRKVEHEESTEQTLNYTCYVEYYFAL